MRGVLNCATLDLLDEFYRQGVEMHGLMLLRHGQVYAEGHWAPYNAQTPHILFSFSKSLTSTAIGFAVQEGILSLEDKLVDLFPDKVPENPSENLQACCVRDLLMTGWQAAPIGFPSSWRTPLSTSRAPTFCTTPRAPICFPPSSPGKPG